MKKFRVINKLKKALIVIITIITIAFLMPEKSGAGPIVDFTELALHIPDGVMHVIDHQIAGSREFTYEEIDMKNADYGGRGAIYNFIMTPYEIFSSGNYEKMGTGDNYYTKLGLLDINFFSNGTITSDTDVSSSILAPVIGNIYKTLRNLCLVLMMLVLLYMGIKIMISSIAEQQAKYKQLLVDWLVGFALLFLMHYIMSAIVNLNTMVVALLSNEEGDSYYVGVSELADNGNGSDSTWYDIVSGTEDELFWGYDSTIKDVTRYSNFKTNKLSVRNGTSENDTYTVDVSNDASIDLKKYSNLHYQNAEIDTSKWGDNGVIHLSASIHNENTSEDKYDRAIVKLNLLSYVRTIASFSLESTDAHQKVYFYQDGGVVRADDGTAMGYSALYVCLVLEVIMFTFIYIKRVLQMAFLTMVAPIVAIMYPVDKIGDGKAQAFNSWFKDYLFNILIQPMHLLLYNVFIVQASELVTKHTIYALAIYGFMIPAEKYFKKILGFEKASNGAGGPLSNALGRSLAMDGLGKFAGIGPASRIRSGSGNSERRRPKLTKSKIAESSDRTLPASSGVDSTEGSDTSTRGGGRRARSSDMSRSRTMPESSGSRRTGDSSMPTVDTRLPSAGGGRLRRMGNALSGTAGAGVRSLGHRISKAMTGKYDSPKGLPKGQYARAIGRNLGRFALRNGARIAGAGMIGAVGTIAGVASAMATGDINNIWRGATVGAKAGEKLGGNAFGTFDDLSDEVKAERAKEDTEYRNRLRREEAFENLQEELADCTPDEREKLSKIIEDYAPYMSFSSIKDVKSLQAGIKSIHDNGAEMNGNQYTRENMLDMVDEVDDFPNIRTHKDEYMDYCENELGMSDANEREQRYQAIIAMQAKKR